jgi:predicted histone-like DNA-binding protein
MTVKYKVIKQATPGVKGGGEYKYYPRITNRRTVKMPELCKQIGKASTFSSADVMGVLHAFIEHIPILLKENKSIDLEGLGIISLHATAEGSDEEKDVSSRNIKDVKISFRPSKRLKQEVADTKFEKAKF